MNNSIIMRKINDDAYYVIVAMVYLAVSFYFGIWAYSWLIFLYANALRDRNFEVLGVAAFLTFGMLFHIWAIAWVCIPIGCFLGHAMHGGRKLKANTKNANDSIIEQTPHIIKEEIISDEMINDGYVDMRSNDKIYK